MKGLYVYGALLMALSFATGALLGSPWAMGLAIVSCSLAALSEAVHESDDGYVAPMLRLIGNCIAVSSWFATGIAAIVALSVIGGL